MKKGFFFLTLTFFFFSGYDRLNDTYVQCSESDVRCGMLHCQHLNERLEFGTESAAILSHSFINSGGRIIPCR